MQKVTIPFTVLHTIAGTRIDHGGTSRSVPNLCNALAQAGVSVQMVAGTPADSSVACNLPAREVAIHLVQESVVHRQWGMRRRFGQMLLRQLTEINDQPPIVHDHGLWLASNRAVAKVTRQMGVPRVVSPRGMLSDWAMSNGNLKKKIAWKLYQQQDLRQAAAFHATSEQEAEDLRSLGFKQPIAIIGNGIELPEVMPKRKQVGAQKRILFLSRIHPVKGLPNLVRAWQHLSPSEDWKLVLAGPDENGHQQELESLAIELGVRNQIEFPGAINDDEKWELYRSAELFVLPSFSENFGIVVAEALAAGLPVITTTTTPWSELAENRIGWWVEPTVQGIAAALSDAMGQEHAERIATGQRAAEWARGRFAWSTTAKQMISFYLWLLEKEDRPTFVV